MKEQTKGIVRYVLKAIINILLMAAILFIAAGRLDWIAGWALVGMVIITQAFTFIVLYMTSPGLIAERSTAQKGSKKWDVIIALTIVLVLPIVTWIVAGLDERFGGSTAFPVLVQVAAAVAFLAGSLFIAWAMASNKFFSGLVRIQDDRGHKVASTGPYRFMRHPGYVGMFVVFMAAPLILGSLWALIPALLIDILLVVRTSLEDKTLQEELPGYKEYVKNVRYRLVPFIW